MNADPQPAPHLKADLALLAITAVWGATFVTVKDALVYADPFTFLALRFGLGALVGLAIAWRHLTRAAWKGGLVLGLFLFGGYAFQTFGLELTTPSRSAFITGLSVILVPFASLALTRRVPPGAAFAGAFIAVLGLIGLTGVELNAPVARGDWLTLGCAVVYAFHIALTERYAKTAHPIALVSVQLLVTALLNAACIPFGARHLENTAGLWGAVAVTGVLASILAISVQVWAQARTTAVRAAVIFALEPVFAIAISVAIGREAPGLRELLGGGLIIFGVVVSEAGGPLWLRLRRQAKA